VIKTLGHLLRPVWAVGLLAAALAGCGEDTAPPVPDAPPPVPEVRIGENVWRVEIAMTLEQRYRGLSGRRHIPEGEGMLFIYPREKPLAYCMRGCDIPIDIAFINAAGKITAIHEMQVEEDRAGRVNYVSGSPAQYVLEVAGGTFARKNVRMGDRVRFSPGVPDAAKATPGP